MSASPRSPASRSCWSAREVRRCQELGVAVLPGTATATDLTAALREGLVAVKLFPAASLGGVAMVDALSGLFPGMRIVPTGGIGVDDLPRYLARPSVLAVGARCCVLAASRTSRGWRPRQSPGWRRDGASGSSRT
jgi:2-dehydro-3-deoxyphosphogluconate aldolase / (4S)-4-hydroxy-2-oxoglutarate aldolase